MKVGESKALGWGRTREKFQGQEEGHFTRRKVGENTGVASCRKTQKVLADKKKEKRGQFRENIKRDHHPGIPPAGSKKEILG